MKRSLLILPVLLLALSVFATGGNDIVTIAMDPSDKICLNPYIATDSDSVIILQNLYEGLFSYNAETSKPEKALAEDYSVSEDGLTWTFRIRDDARFSDGSKITSQSFAQSWEYLKNGPLAENLSFAEKIETPDAQTLVVRLEHPVSYLPSLLCQPCLAAVNPTNSGTFSGPYKIKNQKDKQILLSKSAFYREEIKNDKVRILLGPDFSKEFKSGEVQWSLCPVENENPFMITSPLYATTFFYFTATQGPYADNNVRRALSSVVPWNAIRTIQQGILPSESLVPESGAVNNDFADAYSLLEKAGFPKGKNLPAIKVGIHRGDQVAAISQFISQLWSKSFGITVETDTVPITVYTSDPKENPYDFCIVTWIGDYIDPMAFLSLFKSDASYNIANFSDAEYDNLLEAASNADEVTRKALLLQAEQILLDNSVVIPLSTAIATNFVRTDILTGWYDNPLDIHPFKELSSL